MCRRRQAANPIAATGMSAQAISGDHGSVAGPAGAYSSGLPARWAALSMTPQSAALSVSTISARVQVRNQQFAMATAR